MTPKSFFAFDQMRAANRGLLKIMLLVTVIFGAFEGLFGRVRYSGDAICYLDMVRAIHAGNWKLALNPYWGIGYPLLIAAITHLFPHNATGEWLAVHLLNLLILAATFLTFYWLLWTAARSSTMSWIVADARIERLLLIGAFSIFLSVELSMDNVSRVGPDMLVTCLVFAAAALLLKLIEQPSGSCAIALGVVLGLGCIVKTIFLPLVIVVEIAIVIGLWKRSRSLPSMLFMLASWAVFAIPSIAGLSWAAGQFTMGESGTLNYAWNVNKVEPGGLWQGQPPGFGTPVHPAQMVSANPHIYLFNGPFPVTFGPFYNPPWYYRGYHSSFHIKPLIRETAGNVLRLLRVMRFQLLIYALLIAWLLTRPKSKPLPKSMRNLWPLMFISIAAISIYLLVYVEARYIASFLAMLMLVLLFAVLAQMAATERTSYTLRNHALLVWIVLIACAGTLLLTAKDADRDVVGHALHRHIFLNDEQWKAGVYLAQSGMQPGDKVAVMTDLVSATRANWAYMDRLQIIGILGGSLLETQTADSDAYWQADGAAREQMFAPFREAGARLVLTRSKPMQANAEGWTEIPGTEFWIYKL